jgi:hypothetical protein
MYDAKTKGMHKKVYLIQDFGGFFEIMLSA